MAGTADLVELLPHRPPMRLLDAAAMSADGILLAHQTVPVDGAVLRAHFPGFPLWPGALLLEAMAQTTAVWMLDKNGGLGHQRIPVLGAVDCVFVRPVAPGSDITYHTSLVRQLGDLGIFSVSATTSEGTVARARITAGIRPESSLLAGLRPPQAR